MIQDGQSSFKFFKHAVLELFYNFHILFQLSSQERQILAQDILISHLRESLKTAEMNLQNTQSNFQAKQEELSELFQYVSAVTFYYKISV